MVQRAFKLSDSQRGAHVLVVRCSVRLGKAWLGRAGRGSAWLGSAWHGLAWQGLAWQGPARRGPARRGAAGHGKARAVYGSGGRLVSMPTGGQYRSTHNVGEHQCRS